ncbi:hypothetical protein G6F22_020671 [Rhizopus arrhizus]|nr:hypothetical protein G6F22_020671 [Rhizopus arrhizus]
MTPSQHATAKAASPPSPRGRQRRTSATADGAAPGRAAAPAHRLRTCPSAAAPLPSPRAPAHPPLAAEVPAAAGAAASPTDAIADRTPAAPPAAAIALRRPRTPTVIHSDAPSTVVVAWSPATPTDCDADPAHRWSRCAPQASPCLQWPCVRRGASVII